MRVCTHLTDTIPHVYIRATLIPRQSLVCRVVTKRNIITKLYRFCARVLVACKVIVKMKVLASTTFDQVIDAVSSERESVLC